MSKGKVKTVRTDADRKKAFKGLIGALCALLAIILIVGIVLGFVSRSGFSTFGDYEYVSIYSTTKSQTILNLDTETEDNADQYHINKLFKEGLKSSKYSILRSIFEGNAGKSVRFQMEDVEVVNEDDDSVSTESQRVEIARKDIESQVSESENGYAIVFTYKNEQCIKVEGENVYFNTASVFVFASDDNIIQDYTVYFYDSTKLSGDEFEEYAINPVIIKASAFNFKEKIDEIFEYLN